MSISALLSGGLAALLSLMELVNARRRPPCLRATHWILGRLAFDAGTAMLAYPILASALAGLTWFTGALPIVVAGLAGPAFLRSQLALLGSGQESNTYGPANVYKRIQKQIDDNISEIGLIAQSDWVLDKVPLILLLDLEETCKRMKGHIETTNKIKQSERKTRLQMIDDAFGDASLSSAKKVQTATQCLVDAGGIRLARSLVRRARKMKGSQPESEP